MNSGIPPFIRKPASQLAEFLVAVKNMAYDYDLLDAVQISKPVISVGNLSMGGVGKTPFVGKLIQLCRERGIRPAVIARNYKARSRGVHRVLLNYNHPDFKPASFYGDEPYMLAQKYPDVPVLTGPMKYFTAQVASQLPDVDLLIVDDGFQHRSLHRDFEIVLIDSSRPDQENKIFPAGCLRENFSSLLRADLVVLTKTEMASLEQIEQLKGRIPPAIPQLQTRSHVAVINSGKAYLAVAGIAHPQQFFTSLNRLGISCKGYMSFPDHHIYDQKTMDQILQEMRLVGADALMTTEKDAVKLKAFENLENGTVLPIETVDLDIEFLSEARGLNAFLDQCASH